MDSETKMFELKNAVKKFREDRDWDQFHTPLQLTLALNLEVAELLEIFQWKEDFSIDKIKQDSTLYDKFKEELADVFICAIGLADKLELDVSSLVFNKLAVNDKKYPVKKAKGSNKKYSEL